MPLYFTTSKKLCFFNFAKNYMRFCHFLEKQLGVAIFYPPLGTSFQKCNKSFTKYASNARVFVKLLGKIFII
jgi:hypothetical protein